MFRSLIHKFIFLDFFKQQEKNEMLKVFKNLNCIFFHIPKTAGMSVSNALFGDVKWGHRNVSFYKSHYGENLFNSFFKFCFVRNPYDRIFSAFTFLKNGGINNQDLKFSKSHLHKYNSFNDFVLRGLEKEEIMNWIHFRPQYTFVCDKNDNLVMNFVGKMENLSADFNVVCKHLNIDSELKKINVNSTKKIYFSEEVKSIIKLKYQKDFSLFYPHL